ncbi:LLM class flavin-dependent oxidoreductase, partial [Staphylococcus aureus]
YGEVNEIMAISYIYDKDMQLDAYRRFKNVINQINEKNTL